LPRDFLDQVSLWKKPLPHAPLELDQETAWGKDPSRSGGKRVSAGLTAEQAVRRIPRPLLLLGIPIVAGLLGAGAVLFWGGTGTYTLVLSSNPAGATVFVDGNAQRDATPVMLELSAASPHTVAV